MPQHAEIGCQSHSLRRGFQVGRSEQMCFSQTDLISGAIRAHVELPEEVEDCNWSHRTRRELERKIRSHRHRSGRPAPEHRECILGENPREVQCLQGREQGWRQHRLRQKVKKENFKWKKENGEVIAEARRGGNSGKSVSGCHILQRRRMKRGERKISH